MNRASASAPMSVAALLVLFAGPLHAICGTSKTLPAVVTELVDGLSAEQRTAVEEPLSQLRIWLVECDETASRVATAGFRRLASRSSSVRGYTALFAISLARSVEIYPVGSSGYLYHATYKNSNTETEARDVLLRAGRIHPGRGLLQELVTLALATRNRSTLDAARKLLEHREADFANDPDFWIARAEIAIATKNYAAAIGFAVKAIDYGSASGLRSAGVAQMLSGDTRRGAAQYIEGLNRIVADSLGIYYEDLRLVMNDLEKTEWLAMPSEKRRGWLLRRWTLRASVSAITIEERIAEHHRRIARALSDFMKTGTRVSGPSLHESSSIDTPFDDRGLIYIRHGEPARVIRGNRSRAGGIQRTAWVYLGIGTRPAIFEFSLRPGWPDYLLSSPLKCEPWLYMYGDPGPSAERKFRMGSPDSLASTAWQSDMLEDFTGYASEIGKYDRSVAMQAASCWSHVRSAKGLEERRVAVTDASLRDLYTESLTRRSLRTALASESAGPPLAMPVRPTASFYTFRGENGTEVVAFVGIRGDALAGTSVEGQVRYSLRTTLAVEYASGHVERRDTTIEIRTQQLTSDALVRLAINLPAVRPDTSVTVRLTIRDVNEIGRGQMIVSVVDIPDYNETPFTISDVVLADPGTLVWRRQDVALGPIPGHNVPGDAFRIYYELYGASAGDSLQTTILVTPGRAEGNMLQRLRRLTENRQALSVTFTDLSDVGSKGVMRVLRDVGGGLEPGIYELSIRVRNLRSGVTVERQTDIRILETPPRR